MTRARDSVDRHVEAWSSELAWLDPLQEAVVARMMIVTKYLERERSRSFAAGELTLSSFKVLLTLRRLGPPYTTSPSDLADRLGLSRGALSARLSPLEDDGLLVRRVDPDDRRRVHVTLTDAGIGAFDEHGRLEGGAEAALLGHLPHADLKRLADLLRVLVRAVEEPVSD